MVILCISPEAAAGFGVVIADTYRYPAVFIILSGKDPAGTEPSGTVNTDISVIRTVDLNRDRNAAPADTLSQFSGIGLCKLYFIESDCFYDHVFSSSGGSQVQWNLR